MKKWFFALTILSASFAQATINTNTGYFEPSENTTVLGSKDTCTIHAAYYAPSQVMILKHSHSTTGFYCATEGKSILLSCASGRCENKEQKLTLYSLTPDRFLVAVDQEKQKAQVEFNFVTAQTPQANKFFHAGKYGWEWNIVQTGCKHEGKSYTCSTIGEKEVLSWGLCDQALSNSRKEAEKLCLNAKFATCIEVSGRTFPHVGEVVVENVMSRTGCRAEVVVEGR